MMGAIFHAIYEDDVIVYTHMTKHSPPASDYQPHSHTCCELIFYKQGAISYTVDGRRYKLSRNNLVLSRPFAIHSIEIDGAGDYERYNILFDEKTLPYDVLGKIPPGLDVLNFDGNPSVVQLFEKMDYYCSHLEGMERARILRNLIEEIFVTIVIEAGSAAARTYTQTNAVICAAIAYIEEHLTTLTGLDEICRELYITKSHLHHLFTEHLQITPKKFIVGRRLAMAQREICSGGRPTEVCRRCGFADYSSFYRAYTAHYGHRPSEKSTDVREILSSDNTPHRTPQG